MPADRSPAEKGKDGKVFGEEGSIVGIHAHAGAHGHDHGSRDGHVVEVYDGDDDDDGHGHSHGFDDGDSAARHTVVSQVKFLSAILLFKLICFGHVNCTIDIICISSYSL